MLSKWFKKKKSQSSSPKPIFNLQMDLTYCCNLSCRHCYQSSAISDKNELSLSEWKEVLSQFENLTYKLGVIPSVLLSGGEPLVWPNLNELIQYIYSKQIEISLLTNGTLVNSKFAVFLKKYNVQVQISIDGGDADSHDYFRGKGSFEKAAKGLEQLRVYNVPFVFQSVLQKYNCGQIHNFFNLAKQFGAQAMNFTRYLPNMHDTNEKTNEVQNMLSGKELKKVFEEILFYSKEYMMPTATHQPLWCLIDPHLGHPSSAGFLGLTIAPDGQIQLTSRIFDPIGDAKKPDGLIKAYFDNKTVNKLRQGKIRGCSNCRHFLKCRGDRNISYVLSGDFLGPDEHCWFWQETFK
ncbi:MAG: radical SAM protein [Pseudomonadota bacterium]